MCRLRGSERIVHFFCVALIMFRLPVPVCPCACTFVLFSALDPFYIELEFEGTWTEARQAAFQSAADA